jgi:glycogen(starch) synthase
LHALIAAADALVIPSIYEPFGLVALEGAALGAPLVVARTGGLAEFVEDGVTGRVFVPGDVADLARAATEAINDADASAAMARTARDRLESSYRWELLAGQTRDTYEEARAHHGRTTAPPVWIPPRGVNLLRA